MMAASVPILRTLLRQTPESAKQPFTATMTKRTATDETISMGNKSTVVIESNRSSSEKRVSFWGLLGDEEKSSGHAREGSGQIWRVNEVAVEYEPRKTVNV